MPPTSSPWLKAFEAVGRIGFWRKGGPFDGLVIGDPHQLYDCTEDVAWRRYTRTRALYDAWSPAPASPWSAYTKPTLFAALDDFHPHPERTAPLGSPPSPDSIGPSAVPGLDTHQPAKPPSEPRTAILLDLPGERSVALAAWLARFGTHQPVVLFNNWPHSRGLVDMTKVLGAMLHFAPWADFERNQRPLTAPPVFVLDRHRMGPRPPRPLDFDNRYFHNDSDFPSAATLKKNGIERVLYVHPPPPMPTGTAPVPQPIDAMQPIPLGPWMTPRALRRQMQRDQDEQAAAEVRLALHDDADDVNPYLVQLAKAMPLSVATEVAGWGWSVPEPFAPRPRATPFNTTKDPRFLGYRRSAAGGFGKLVPEPSSGGG